jgi:hypothetical protein
VDLISLFRLLARRKWVVIPLAFCGFALVVAVVVSAPPMYRSSGSITFLPPPAVDEKNATPAEVQASQNPYARYGDLSIVVDIIRRIMVSETNNATLVSRGLKGTYTVGANLAFDRSPVVEVVAESPTAEQAKADALLVMGDVDQQLVKLQNQVGTDPKYQITTAVVVTPTRATRLLTSTIRRAISVLALVGAVILIGAVLADIPSRRRRAVQAAAEQRSAPPLPLERPLPEPAVARVWVEEAEPQEYYEEPAPRRTIAAARPVAVGPSRSPGDAPAEDLRPNRRRAGRSLPGDVRRSV